MKRADWLRGGSVIIPEPIKPHPEHEPSKQDQFVPNRPLSMNEPLSLFEIDYSDSTSNINISGMSMTGINMSGITYTSLDYSPPSPFTEVDLDSIVTMSPPSWDNTIDEWLLQQDTDTRRARLEILLSSLLEEDVSWIERRRQARGVTSPNPTRSMSDAERYDAGIYW